MKPEEISILSSLGGHHKAALVSLVIEVVNVDNEVTGRELGAVNQFLMNIGIDDHIYELGKRFEFDLALETLALTDKAIKTAAANLLIEIAEADGTVQVAEQRLLQHVLRVFGLI